MPYAFCARSLLELYNDNLWARRLFVSLLLHADQDDFSPQAAWKHLEAEWLQVKDHMEQVMFGYPKIIQNGIVSLLTSGPNDVNVDTQKRYMIYLTSC